MTTTNYSWTLPTVGGSTNTWGTLLNAVLTDIDAKMFARTGGTISGNVAVVGTVSATGRYKVTSASDAMVQLTNTTASTGKDWLLNSHSDGKLYFGVNGVANYADFSSTGLAVTGTGSFTGAVNFGQGGVANAILNTSALGMYFNVDSDANEGPGGGFFWGTDRATDSGGTTWMSLSSTGLAVTGIVTPEADNTRTLGTGALRWSTVYAGTGTINTSDEREKTKVRTLAAAEIEAAKDHSKEIGIYQFLESVKAKGDKARLHIGMTVQRSIQIMEKHGLDPMAYGFICHDVWADEFVEHPSIEAVEAKAAVLDDDGNEVDPAIEAVEGKDAWTEQTQTAGDRYAFRYDQLNLFIARGIEARLDALEARA